MKIIFYIGNLKKGGAERVVSVLSNSFSTNNEVTIITTRDDKIEYGLDKSIKIISLDDGKKRNIVSKNLFYLLKLKRIINKEKTDIVIPFLPEPTYRILLIKPFIHTKVIISDRNDPKIEYKKIINKILMKLLFRKSDGFVFQTEAAKKYFSKKIQERSVVIKNPIDEEFFKTKYKYEGSKTFINIGRLNEQKNQLFLIQCFEEIIKKYPEFMLHIYGDGNLRNVLQEYIDKKQINNNIKLCGTVDNVSDVLKDKYAFILSSKYEGLPNALMEAMAVGVPCISTDCPCGGPKELVDNNVNGILVELNNKNQLINEIIDLIENRSKCDNLSINAKKSMKKYSIEQISDEWQKYIKEVIKK